MFNFLRINSLLNTGLSADLKNITQQISHFHMMASLKDMVFTDFLNLRYNNLDKAIIVGGGNVFITPGFGSGSKLFIIKPYSIVSSTDPREGWGGWGHGFGHHSFVCCAEEGKLDSMPRFLDPGTPPIQFMEPANKLGCFLTPKNFSRSRDYDKFINLLTTKYPSVSLNKDLIVLKIEKLYTIIASNKQGSQWLEENLQYKDRCDLTEKDLLAIKLMYI